MRNTNTVSIDEISTEQNSELGQGPEVLDSRTLSPGGAVICRGREEHGIAVVY